MNRPKLVLNDVDHKARLEELNHLAAQLRVKIIETSHRAKIPHLGSCLSCADLLTAIYFYALHIDCQHPRSPKRDRFILSKGHAAPALFQILAMRGFYSESLLADYGEDGSIFAEHPPAPCELPGIEAATGSLGHGLPIGVGMALAARLKQLTYHVYVLLGDGECNEGSIWEAAMFAAAQKINNLCVLIDFNKWQATDKSCEVMALNPLVDKWRAFGWHTYEIDGHDMQQIVSALNDCQLIKAQPTAIIAHTIKGRGVSFMEDNNNWHYRIPSASELASAKVELLSKVESA